MSIALPAAILAFSAACLASASPLPPRVSDETSIPARLAHVLRDLDGSLKRPYKPGLTFAPIVTPRPFGEPEQMVPALGFTYDFPAHPERALREERVTSRLRASIELAAILGYGFANYWYHMADNAVDWELSWSTTSFRKKTWTFEAVRFDNNKFDTNAVSHPAAGVLTYLTARGNGLSIGESFGFALAGSALWEYFGEYREKVSINDLIFTPQAGPAIGEPLHQLALFFEKGEDNLANRILALGFSPFRFLHQHLGRWYTVRARALDDLGLPADIWHRFDLLVGVSSETGKDGIRLSEQHIGVSTEIVDVPEYEHPGKARRSLPAGAVTSMRFSGTLDDSGVHQLDFLSRLSLGGLYDQSITPDLRGGRSGHALFIGPATAFNYATHNYDASAQDQLAVVNALGATLDATLYQGKARARLGLDVYGDFAAVHSMAVGDYLTQYGKRGLKTVLADKRYYFALGATARATLALAYRRVEIGAQLTQDFFESIEGLDRFQERVANDLHLSDRRGIQRVWLSYTLPGERLKLTWIELERQSRSGDIAGITASRSGTNVRAGLALRF